MTEEALPLSDAELGVERPDDKPILAAQQIEDPKDRVRALYQLSLHYRDLSRQALQAAKVAANDANAEGLTFREMAEHAGCKSASSLARMRG